MVKGHQHDIVTLFLIKPMMHILIVQDHLPSMFVLFDDVVKGYQHALLIWTCLLLYFLPNPCIYLLSETACHQCAVSNTGQALNDSCTIDFHTTNQFSSLTAMINHTTLIRQVSLAIFPSLVFFFSFFFSYFKFQPTLTTGSCMKCSC